MKNFYLRVLGYKEDNEFVMYCLEMDLKGYGKTEKEALSDLTDLIKMQVSFAIQKKEPNLLWFPAEPKYFMLYEQLKEQYLRTLKKDKNYVTNGIPFDLINLKQKSAAYVQSI